VSTIFQERKVVIFLPKIEKFPKIENCGISFFAKKEKLWGCLIVR
jgi:hypothetical protein